MSRVLIAAGIYPPDAGGPAIHAKAQFEGFPKFGFETSVVALAHFRKWPRWIRHLFFLLALMKKAFRSDLIYAHDAWGAGFPALIAARLTGNKIMIRVGGDLAWEQHAEKENLSMNEWYQSGVYHRDKMFLLSRFLLRRVDQVVVIGKSLADLYERVYGVNRSKIKIILNPVSETPSLEIKKEKNIIFASRLTNYKNLAMAIKVLTKVFPKHPDLKFIIIGDGPGKTNLQLLADSLKLGDQVQFLGSVPQEKVFEYTAKCLLTIAPALTEFNPNYVLQGISFGKPFIISRENDLPFRVPEELMFDPRNEQELEMRILDLLDESKYQEAKKKITEIDFKMTWDDNLRENTKIINSLLNG